MAKPKETTDETVTEVKSEFSVFDSQSKFVRTYTLEIHGEDAEKLAKQFAGKIKGSVK